MHRIEYDDDEDGAAFCGVAKVSPTLLQRLECQCWDVVRISLVRQRSSSAAKRTLSKHADDTADDMVVLTSCIVQVIPDELCMPNQMLLHPLLLDFLQVAAEEEEEQQQQQLSAVMVNNNNNDDTDATRSPVAVEIENDIANEAEVVLQSTSPIIAVQLASFGAAQDDDTYDERVESSPQKQQQLQWTVRKVLSLSSSSPRNTSSAQQQQQQLNDGSTLVVHCVYSDAPILHQVQVENDDDSGDHHYFSQDDLTAALEDRLVQKGSVMLLYVSSCSSSSSSVGSKHHHHQAQQQGYVIVLLQDIFCLPTTCTTDSTTATTATTTETTTGDDNKVYRLGTRASFRLSVTSPPPSLLSSKSATVSGARVVDDQDSSSSSSCPGYESLQQQLIQLLSPRSTYNLKSSSSSFCCRPSGVLLTGSVGVGKTRVCKCVARQLRLEMNNCNVHYISLQDLHLQATTTTSTTTLDDLKSTLLPPSTNVLIIDDLHILASEDAGSTMEQEQQGTSFPDMERQLMQSALLQVVDACVEQGIPFLGIGSTEQWLLPAMLVKFGRLEKQLEMPSPTQHQREMILQHKLGEMMNMSLSERKAEKHKARQWASILAPLTAGCVAADLCRLCHTAQMRSWARQQQQAEEDDDDEHHDSFFAIASRGDTSDMTRGLALPPQPPPSWEDLREAAQELVPLQLATLDVIKPMPPALVFDDGNTSFLARRSKNDDWLAIHEQSWSRLAGYAAVKKRVYRAVVAPWRRFLKHENQKYSGDHDGVQDEPKAISTSKLLIPPPTGILFHGASGSGKTLAAFCLGASLEWSMIHVHTATDVLDQWLGGSEAALRSLFARARAASPCILFLDEIDAIVCNRNNDNDGDSTNVMTRLLSTLLNEMDGIAGSSSSPTKVLVVACTNQPLDSLDAALLRPGRLDQHVELKTPVTLEDAVETLQLYLTRKNNTSQTAAADSILHPDVDLKVVAHHALEASSKKLGAVTGADLEGLAREATLLALRRNLEESSAAKESRDTTTNDLVSTQVTMKDFNDALVQI